MTKTGDEKALVELEMQFWQAVQDQDAESAKRLTDESCLLAGSSGIARVDHKKLEGMMTAGSHTLERFDLSEFDVRLVGKDVALVGYKVHEDLVVDGKRVSMDAADTSTWVRRKGRWLCAVHTESVLGDPFGRDRARTTTSATASAAAP